MIILASQSPRRQELLRLITPNFEVMPTNCDEHSDIKQPKMRCLEIATRKAQAAAGYVHSHDAVIASDTVVFIEGEILEKPRDEQDAFDMLKRLSGKTHQVCTAVVVAYEGAYHRFVSTTDVTFNAIDDKTIKRYIATGEPMDKAGAYGIQGFGAVLVDSIKGDYFTVMGLPVSKLCSLLVRIGAIG